MARILITGGAGYVGSHCAKALAAAGHEGIVFDSLLFGHREFVRRGTLVEGNIRDAAALDAVFAAHRIDAVMRRESGKMAAMFAFRWARSLSQGRCSRRYCGSSLNCGQCRHQRLRKTFDIQLSRATDGRTLTKCQGKWVRSDLRIPFAGLGCRQLVRPRVGTYGLQSRHHPAQVRSSSGEVSVCEFWY